MKGGRVGYLSTRFVTIKMIIASPSGSHQKSKEGTGGGLDNEGEERRSTV